MAQRLITAIVVTLILGAAFWFGAFRQTDPLPEDWKPLFASIDGDFKPRPGGEAEGEARSHVHCSACHLRPDPDILPLESWIEVLRIHLGRFNQAGILVGPEQAAADSDEGLREARLSLPHEKHRGYRLPRSDFTDIIYFYLKHAPTRSLPQRGKPAFAPEPAPFELIFAPHASMHNQAQYTLATFESESGRMILGDSANRSLVVLDARGQRLWSIPVGGIYPTSLMARPDGIHVVRSGPDLQSVVESLPDGKVLRFPPSALEERMDPVPMEEVVTGLQFPIHITFADLDDDGRDELIVEEFGMSEGALSWYKQTHDAYDEKNILYDGPGSLDTIVEDLTGNGRPDILAMVTQAEQAIYLFENQGRGQFEKRLLLRKHPAFGFDAMFLEDMNGDGRLEIITVNGDNDLETQPLRPYHGVRIWRDTGDLQFEEAFFYPMHGAIQAVIRDFNGNGRLDIVAVSLWPDFQSLPLESAVYLENDGHLSFTPRRIPGSERGRWAVIGAGDLDGNGFDDLLLGALYLPGYLPPLIEALGGTRPLSYAVFRNTSDHPLPRETGALSPDRNRQSPAGSRKE